MIRELIRRLKEEQPPGTRTTFECPRHVDGWAKDPLNVLVKRGFFTAWESLTMAEAVQEQPAGLVALEAEFILAWEHIDGYGHIYAFHSPRKMAEVILGKGAAA